MKKERLYRNKRKNRKIPLLDATWFYLGHLAEQMGMTIEEYVEFALRGHITDRRAMIDFNRKWKAERDK